MTEICKAWAEKEKVDLKIDYISTQGNKLLMTIALEAQARSGHDVMDFSAWEPAQHAASGSSPWAARHRHGFEGLHDRALLLLGFAARPIRCEQVKFLRATRQTTTPRQAPLRQLLALSL
jgi:hypothetical protein